MVKPQVSILASSISHMPLHYVWADSGVCERQGFALTVHIANVDLPGQPVITPRARSTALLDGSYDFISGLHHEPYVYRARGDKRFVYLAQAQNDWDDRLIASDRIRSASDLNGKRVLLTSSAPCVAGNLKHTIALAGGDLDRIEFVRVNWEGEATNRRALDMVTRGEADAAGVDIPYDRQGEKRGLHTLDLPNVPVIHNTTVCSNAEWVRDNEETTLAFLRSFIDAIHFFKTEPQKVCEILDRRLTGLLQLEGPDEVEHLQRVWAALLSPKPYPHPLAIWNVYNLDVAHNPAVNFIGPFEPWDTSYLRTVDDSGYIDELYGGEVAAANPPVNIVI